MGWLQSKVEGWAISKQRQELENWLNMLRAMNSDEVGMVVATATHFRHQIEKAYGLDPLDPTLAYKANPNIVLELHRVIKGFQASGQQAEAAAVMVWMFTFRCGAALQLRSLGRELWRELRRGFPYVEDQAVALMSMTGNIVKIHDYERIPIGLEPERT